MDTKMQKLEEWLTSIREYEPPNWDRLPELDLYMDQVITFLNKLLAPFAAENERPLTSSMINNYVKDEVLPRPNKKKYSRDHLAMLVMIYILKSILSLPEIHEIITGLTAEKRVMELYPDFADKQKRTLQEVADRLDAMPDHNEDTLLRTAVGLALEANARRVAAARILDVLAPKEDAEMKKDKGK